ncbi:MAG TPA: hypothetical protein VFV09_06210 [Actinomycetota bacterium]|nr:hypothetical protein [Actinomycetota bacterium]
MNRNTSPPNACTAQAPARLGPPHEVDGSPLRSGNARFIGTIDQT